MVDLRVEPLLFTRSCRESILHQVTTFVSNIAIVSSCWAVLCTYGMLANKRAGDFMVTGGNDDSLGVFRRSSEETKVLPHAEGSVKLRGPTGPHQKRELIAICCGSNVMQLMFCNDNMTFAGT